MACKQEYRATFRMFYVYIVKYGLWNGGYYEKRRT